MYIKCLAILIQNCYSSEIVDERNFSLNEEDEISEFMQKYKDEKYRCVKFVLT